MTLLYSNASKSIISEPCTGTVVTRPVRMTQAMVAAVGANDNEAELFENGDDVAARQTRQSAPADTVTR